MDPLDEPIIKISTLDNAKVFKMITASTLKAVVEKGIEKLKLPQAEYKAIYINRKIDVSLLFCPEDIYIFPADQGTTGHPRK